MTILFVGNTPADMGNAATTHTTEFARDSAYSPNGIRVVVPGAVIGFDTFTTSADFWFHCKGRSSDYTLSSYADGHWLKVYNSTNTAIAMIDTTNGEIQARVMSDATEVSGTFYIIENNAEFTLDVNVVTGVDITMTVYINGIEVSSATTPNTTAEPGASRVLFEHVTFPQRQQPLYTYDWHYSEFIATSGESTIGWRLATLEPDSAGNYGDWAGGFAALNNDYAVGGAAASANGERVSSIFSAYGGPSSPAGIRAVVSKAHAYAGATGPQHLKHFLRISATDYEGTAQSPVFTKPSMEIWDNNPNTATGWTSTDLAALEAGLKAET